MLYVVSNVPAEVQTQKSIDAFYAKTGPCCAGCDYWRWMSATVGECVRFPPNQNHDAAAGLGMTSCSLPRSTSILTTRDHWCGEFRDDPDHA